MMKYTSIRKFKKDLIRELRGLEHEIIMDAVSNSEDHLNLMVEEILQGDHSIGMKNAVMIAVDSFGEPSDIAEGYRSFGDVDH